MRRALAAGVLLALLGLPVAALAQDDDLYADPEESEEEPSAEPAQAEAEPAGSEIDPWEPMNRRIFAFNETVDRYALEPVATGWDFVLPDRVQTSITNFRDHLVLPTRFANDVLQLKLWQAYETAWRAIVNTTVGVGGLFDVASMWKIKKSDEDFGQTLGYWGVPPGPYLVLPLLGPSSPRDAAGSAVDRGTLVHPWFVPFYVSWALTGVEVVNQRAAALETIREERKAAFDWYAAVRSAYRQYRQNQVEDRPEEVKGASDDDDLYFDDDEAI